MNAHTTEFEWDCYARKAPEIVVQEDIAQPNGKKLIALRTKAEGHNPALLANLPLTRENPRCRFKIIGRGEWIGIGLADNRFQVYGGKTLGTQTRGLNCGYFWQVTGIHKLQMVNQVSTTDVQPIQVGDTIDIIVDFDQNRILFFKNETMEGMISCSEYIPEGALYPCANLSAFSIVVLTSDVSKLPKLNTKIIPRSYHWHWSSDNSKKAEAIELAAVNITHPTTVALRTENSPKGTNPAVMTEMAFNRNRSHIRVKILSLGKWIGIGVCDGKFQVNESKTLGSQKCLNSSYFSQYPGVNRIGMWGEVICEKGITPIAVNDVIDVKINFNTNKIYYFNNERFQGMICPTQFILKENRIFPCVNMSVGTCVEIVNQPISISSMQITDGTVDSMEVDYFDEIKIMEQVNKYEMRKDFALQTIWSRPVSQFPTRWVWATGPQMKAKDIIVHENGLVAKRGDSGNNPAILTSQPFTRNSFYFAAQVRQLGGWIGIGLADNIFLLNGSKTLGQQTCGVNSSYFYQQNVRKLQMFGEQSVNGVEPVHVGDVISLAVDFDSQKVYYFHNELLQGAIFCTRNLLAEGRIYPSVDLAADSEVAIVNVDALPYTVAAELNMTRDNK